MPLNTGDKIEAKKVFKDDDKHRLLKYSNVCSITNGSLIEAVTNDEFDTAFRTIKSENPVQTYFQKSSLKDGWSVKTNSQNNIQSFTINLGNESLVYGFDIDTSFFNFEEFLLSVEGMNGNPKSKTDWITLSSPTSLICNSHNFFELSSHVALTHIRINGHSAGGVARLRVYGHNIQPLSPRTITADPLTTESYQPYGDVIHPKGALNATEANQGTASKFHNVAQVINQFPQGDGKPNLCIFRCQPTQQLPFTVKLLERHPYSTQAFIPMTSGGTRGYLVVVALNGIDDRPDMSTLRAFIASSTQGISYRQGVWHHPMIALDCVTDFAVLVHENSEPQDNCNEVNVPYVIVRVPGFQANL
ncbi:ureidoglycolate hydrolase-domain-containing protein [Sporodiniella umbellata]|nr:ureidoglycolate hydrolase-domain-containing protein [Sporodiniella umbellata]